MDEDFGPWIEHDGKGNPLPVGVVVQVAFESGNQPVVVNIDGPCWSGGGYKRWRGKRANWAPIIRYRVKKPRGLTLLEDLLRSVKVLERV